MQISFNNLMAHNRNVNRLETEYLNSVKTFNAEVNVKSLTDRITQLSEKNPKIQQLMRNSNQITQKTCTRPYDSVMNLMPTSSAKKSRKTTKENCIHKFGYDNANCKEITKQISIKPSKDGVQESKNGYDGFRSTVQASITPNHPLDPDNKDVNKKNRNFIQANKKNAFSAQKIVGFFEHNQFFTTIKEIKMLTNV